MNVRSLNIVDENVHVLQFPKENIVDQPIAKVNRSLEVKREFFLDNLERGNVLIYFLDHTGLKKVKTKDFTVAKNAIILKHSIAIPLAQIVAVA